ncbi:MAG: hypothetical protein JRE92_00815 [Deltaproteobacteria bacterium]|jgi:hypothetical protein|nr:hypothetical protein [Deltaproteobacteria bacterium]MBW2448952.1 hypothetical protein [Deltaproteobacteria bacterium]
MDPDLTLRRKYALKAHGRTVVLTKMAYEKHSHVMMKAFLWALYLPEYPDMLLERFVDDRYKPDVVVVDELGTFRFWGEAGRLYLNKIRSLIIRYRTTHFAIAKWDQSLDAYAKACKDAVAGLKRTRPIDLIHFSEDSPERFIDSDGEIHISHSDVKWTRIL